MSRLRQVTITSVWRFYNGPAGLEICRKSKRYAVYSLLCQASPPGGNQIASSEKPRNSHRPIDLISTRVLGKIEAIEAILHETPQVTPPDGVRISLEKVGAGATCRAVGTKPDTKGPFSGLSSERTMTRPISILFPITNPSPFP